MSGASIGLGRVRLGDDDDDDDNDDGLHHDNEKMVDNITKWC